LVFDVKVPMLLTDDLGDGDEKGVLRRKQRSKRGAAREIRLGGQRRFV
jgi:hypothetical protein